MNLTQISRRLAKETNALDFAPPTSHVYNPLDYARPAHEAYLERYGKGSPSALLLGMNPRPFGMAQTGVPFGEINLTRDWLGIEEPLAGKPPIEHPKRPIQGFDCPRSEVSGARLWGWAKARYGSPERFFERFFVVNYCPLVFLEASGRNRTPDKLSKAEREALFAVCDRALLQVVETLRPSWVIGVGRFAEVRARSALGKSDIEVGRILHPSPASPLANRGWAEAAESELTDLGIEF